MFRYSAQVRSIFSKSVLPQVLDSFVASLKSRTDNSRTLNQRLRYDFEVDSLPALLRYEDRCSMAFSIEARTPFLDFRVVEFARNLASSLLFADGRSKSILRSAVYDRLPREVASRLDKLGFPSPQEEWLSVIGPEIIKLSEKLPQVDQFINRDSLRRVLSVNRRLSDAERAVVWRCCILLIWISIFFSESIE